MNPATLDSREGASLMVESTQLVAIDREGRRGLIRAFDPQQKQYVVDYEDQTLLIPADLLVALGKTYYKLPLGFDEVLRDEEPDVAESIVIPILEEELHVGKRVIEKSKVRVHKSVHEREVVVDEPLIEDLVEVERVPINRLISKPIGSRVEGEITIVPVLKEVLVVQKQLMLVEEIRLSRRQVEVRRPQPVILRTEEVRIERVAPDETATGAQIYEARHT
jgi:uncharacterized protein (TIGR02271 family)